MTGATGITVALSYLRSALYYLGIVPPTLLVGIVGPLLYPLPFRVRYGILTQWTRFALWWLRLTCGLRFEVEGRENIPAGPAIILSNHQSAWETMGLQAIFPPQTWVLKRELIWVPFFGIALFSLSPVAIDRKAGRKALKQLVQQGRDRLQRGIWLVIFPEGTRVAPGETKPFQPGGALLARETGYPVVPVAHNAGEFWRRSSFLKLPGTVRVRVGPLIDPAGLDVAEINRRAREWIEANRPDLAARA